VRDAPTCLFVLRRACLTDRILFQLCVPRSLSCAGSCLPLRPPCVASFTISSRPHRISHISHLPDRRNPLLNERVLRPVHHRGVCNPRVRRSPRDHRQHRRRQLDELCADSLGNDTVGRGSLTSRKNDATVGARGDSWRGASDTARGGRSSRNRACCCCSQLVWSHGVHGSVHYGVAARGRSRGSRVTWFSYTERTSEWRARDRHWRLFDGSCAHACTHTHTHTNTNKQTTNNTHAHTRTHTHTRTRARLSPFTRSLFPNHTDSTSHITGVRSRRDASPGAHRRSWSLVCRWSGCRQRVPQPPRRDTSRVCAESIWTRTHVRCCDCPVLSVCAARTHMSAEGWPCSRFKGLPMFWPRPFFSFFCEFW
jgi:hypothetical protein